MFRQSLRENISQQRIWRKKMTTIPAMKICLHRESIL